MTPTWQRRAADVVAGFTSTRSKGPDAMFGGPGGPTHMVRAEGARVWTADDRVLVDWTMALGAVSLGYAHPAVVAAVTDAARAGMVGPLPPVGEVTAAEAVAAAYPGAEQVRFFKTGAEAVQAAVRLARVAAGRDVVVHCGYHGWLDGPTAGAGVPRASALLWRAVPFGDTAALEAALAADDVAALVLEPVIEHAAPAAWLAAARALATERGVVLVFDEIKTGFRLGRGGAAERWGVHPDLAVLGKALGNGAPIAAVAGRADLMARCRDTWISSTLATETTALAAVGAVAGVWETTDVAAHIRRVGRQMLDGLPPGPWEVHGLPEMWFLRFADPDLERRFLLACVDGGVLLKRGAYNFPSLAHGEAEVDLSLAAMRRAVEQL